MRALLCLCLLPIAVDAATIEVTNLGDAPGSCPSVSNCTLRAALGTAAAGDTVVLAAPPAIALPAVVQLQGSALVVDDDVNLVGPGADLWRIRAAAGRRVLEVDDGAIRIERVTLSDGQALGSNGMSATAGSGVAGMVGGEAEGGCVRIGSSASATFEEAALENCLARGGTGGNGGSGDPGAATTAERVGGRGGDGGNARGGAIANRGSVVLRHSSVVGASAASGRGGRGGNGGTPGFGSGGDGGRGGDAGDAEGGSLWSQDSLSVSIVNSTFAEATLDAGQGGAGGDGGAAGAAGSRGDGGDGGASGAARGGHLNLASLFDGEIAFSTLAAVVLTTRSGGAPGGGSTDGAAGLSGSASGEVLFVASGVARPRSSALGGATALADCAGTVDGIGNLAGDASCDTALIGAFADHFVPDWTLEGGRVAWSLRGTSAAIDAAASCTRAGGSVVSRDQSGRLRPLDGNGDGQAACDPGALEFSLQLFGNGFEN